MQKKEFIEQTGIECDDREYAIIEGVYLNMPGLVIGYNTSEFCKWVVSNRLTLDTLINVLAPLAGSFLEREDLIQKKAKEIADLREECDLNAMAYEDLKRRYDTVVEVVGADRIRMAVTASMNLDALVDLCARRGF